MQNCPDWLFYGGVRALEIWSILGEHVVPYLNRLKTYCQTAYRQTRF